MLLPFTQAQFLEVFKSYNLAVWPMQAVAYLLTAFTLALVLTVPERSRWAVWGLLAFFWLWNGVVYHIVYFSSINKAAILFGALFVLQSGLFVWAGIKRPCLAFRSGTSLQALLGSLFVLYALFGYPLLGAALGHGYPLSPSFGLAPCPTVIFTFGLLLWTEGKVPGSLVVIPFLWALLGFTAALLLGVILSTQLGPVRYSILAHPSTSLLGKLFACIRRRCLSLTPFQRPTKTKGLRSRLNDVRPVGQAI